MNRLFILGANGQVGWELQRSLAPIGAVKACTRHEVNFEDMCSLLASIREHRPDVIVNAAAYTAVDKAESEPAKAKLINAEAVALLAEEAKRSDAWLIHYSTDYIFDGRKPSPYIESDQAYPLNVYGSTKWEGEVAIRQSECRHLIFRTSWVYASRGQNFIKTMLRMATSRDELSVVVDQFGAPTNAELIADVTALALYHCQRAEEADHPELCGTYHLVAAGETSWFDYARYVFELAEQEGLKLRIKPTEINPITSDDYPVPAERPKNTRLSCDKLERVFNLRLPEWRQQVLRTVRELIEQGEFE